jgi:hypothetical protein
MLSIIILNYKNPALLRLCLKSLKRIVSPRLQYETIVVDSESSFPTQDVVYEEFPDVILLPFKENVGYTRGMNEGMKKAKGDYLLILNPDIVPLKDSIESMLSYMEHHLETGLAGPRLLNFDGSSQDSCFRLYTPKTILARRTFFGRLPFGKKILNYFLMKDADLERVQKVDWLMGSALMTSKKAINTVGLMDEKLFLYMSDVDWARRFWENGYSVIYFPSARMYHYHRRDSKGRFGLLDLFIKKQTRWHLKDAITYFKKYGFKAPRYGV